MANDEALAGEPRVLLLDVMGTLVHDPFFVEMPAFFGMTLDELLRAKHPDAWVRFELGEITEAEFLPSFFADGRAYDHAGFKAHVQRSYRWLEGIEALLGELSERGAAMHALSNYPPWYRLIEEQLEVSRFVEWSFVSSMIGARKPDPVIYRAASERLGVPPGRCVFVDDRESNCAGARAVGMRAVRFEDAGSLRRALVGEGLLG